ncbi:MAG: chromate transporter [Dethiobacter sp.]|jgi:chromate transporter|nr:MAG: chromate transporter [Dethiobacter sp.]
MDDLLHQKEEESQKVKIPELFFLFLSIGTFTIGGGYAMIPLIRREIIDRKKWFDDQDFLDNLAIAQSLPGPLVVNFSLVTGYRLRGFKGGLFSLLGTIIPSFLIILGIAIFLWQYRGNYLVQAAFLGIRPVILALIVSAVFKLGKDVFRKYRTVIFFAAFLGGVIIFNIHPIAVILGGAALGLLWPPGKGRDFGRGSNNNSGPKE